MSGRLPAPRRLLVRLPNPLGDAVMATPALRALHAALPETHITWAGSRAAQGALEGLPWRDDVMPLVGPMRRGWLAPWRASRELRRLGADAALLMPNSFSSALACRLARIGERVGVALHGRGWLLSRRVEVPRDEGSGRLVPRPMTQHYLDLVAPFGAEDDGQGTEVRTTPFDRERAARRLAGVAPGRALVAIHPGAAFGETKIYPPERIARALALLQEQHELTPLVLAGPGEEALARRTFAALEGEAIGTHAAPPDLGELKGLLERADLLLTTDTGPRHLADALGTPSVAWLGPTDPAWSASSPGRIVRHEALPCLGCHLKHCPIGLPCMRRLDPGIVARIALEGLAAPAKG